MVENPYPIPRQLRQSGILVGSGGDTYGPFDFKIFDPSDVVVCARAAGAKRFTEVSGVVVSKVGGNTALNPLDEFTVKFPYDVPLTTRYVVLSSRIAARAAGVMFGTRIDPNALEKELSKIATQQQELRRDVGRSIMVELGEQGLVLDPDLEDGVTIMKEGGRLVAGPDLPELAAEMIASAAAEATRAKQEADKSRSEADRAAAIVNDIASEKEVPIVGIVQALPGLFLPAGMTAIRTNGFAAMGDGGAWPLAVAVENSGPLQPWQRQSNGGTRRWQLVAAEVRPEMFGAKGDDTGDDRSAFSAVRDYVNALGGELILSAAKQYFIGLAGALSMGGISIYAEPGAKIRGNWDFKANYKLLTPVDIVKQDESYDYLPRSLSTKYRRPIAEKDFFFGDADCDRTQDINVSCLTMMQNQITWPGGTWTTITTGSIDADYINFTLSNSVMFAATTALRAGEQLTALFAYGDYDRAAIVRTAKGFYTFRCTGMEGSGALYFNDYAAGTQTLVTNLDWPGQDDQKGFFPGYAEWCIDIISPTKFRFLLSGLAVFGVFTVGAGDFIEGEAGFGVINGSGLGGIKWPVIRRNAPVANRGFLHIAVAGDSRASPKWDDWPTHMRDMLEGSLGANILKLENLAVDGWTTATTLATLQAHGLNGGITHLICDAYNNDAQNGVALATTRQNILDIIDLAQAKNITVIWLLCPGWYPRADTGKGVVTFNDALAPQYRAMARWLSCLRGCRVIDMTHLGKPIMAYEGQSAPGDARFAGSYITGLEDNIHFGPFYSRKVGEAAARVLLGSLPKRTRALDEINVPPSMMRNSWVTGPIPLRISVDDSGNVRLAGRINAGTKTANTQILAIPASMQTAGPRLFKVMGDDNSAVRIQVNGAQLQIVDAVGAGASGLILDGVSWAPR